MQAGQTIDITTPQRDAIVSYLREIKKQEAENIVVVKKIVLNVHPLDPDEIISEFHYLKNNGGRYTTEMELIGWKPDGLRVDKEKTMERNQILTYLTRLMPVRFEQNKIVVL